MKVRGEGLGLSLRARVAAADAAAASRAKNMYPPSPAYIKTPQSTEMKQMWCTDKDSVLEAVRKVRARVFLPSKRAAQKRSAAIGQLLGDAKRAWGGAWAAFGSSRPSAHATARWAAKLVGALLFLLSHTLLLPYPRQQKNKKKQR
jgi:hypothetical protein